MIKDFFNKNKKLLLLVLLLLLSFVLYNCITASLHKKQIKALENRIQLKEKDFQSAIQEKEKLKDSSTLYELIAIQAGQQASVLRVKAEKEKKAKEEALAALRNLPKDVIDSFFEKRYVDIPRASIGLEIDKNVGNEIVVELVEKDHLVQELFIAEELSYTLTKQVSSLETSLAFSKAALTQADSAITIRSEQLVISQDLNSILKEDLKIAKRKTFWVRWKGIGAGIAAGILIGLSAR